MTFYTAHASGFPEGTEIYTFIKHRLNNRGLCNTLQDTRGYSSLTVGCSSRHVYTDGIELVTDNTDMAIQITEIFVELGMELI